MPKGNEYAYGAGPGGGLGTDQGGGIVGPLGKSPYNIEGGKGDGGAPDGPFGAHKQSQSVLPITTRDSLQGAPQQGFGNLGSGGGISTPMDTSSAAMPGLSGSSGSGPISGGGSKLSTPWTGPFGDMVG